MIQVIDTAYFRSFFKLPDGAERLERWFGSIITERDKAKAIADAAGQGYATMDARAKKYLGLLRILQEHATANAPILVFDEAKRHHVPFAEWIEEHVA